MAYHDPTPKKPKETTNTQMHLDLTQDAQSRTEWALRGTLRFAAFCWEKERLLRSMRRTCWTGPLADLIFIGKGEKDGVNRELRMSSFMFEHIELVRSTDLYFRWFCIEGFPKLKATSGRGWLCEKLFVRSGIRVWRTNSWKCVHLGAP